MADVKQIVDVLISRETQAVSQAGFGTPLVVGSSNRISPGKVAVFNSITDAEAVYTAGDPELIALGKIFAQPIVVEQAKGAQRDADVAQVNNVSVDGTDDGTYSIVINLTSFDFIASSSTAAQISAGLQAAIAGGSEPVTAVDNTGNVDVSADVAGDPFTITVVAPLSNLTLTTTTPNRNITTELQLIEDEDPDWYALISVDQTAKNIERAADFIESRAKIYIASSDDADLFTTATTDIATTLKNKALDRTATIVKKSNVDDFPGAGWAGHQLPELPGASTWAFNTLSGIAVDTGITPTEEANAGGKNANLYLLVGGVNITIGSSPKNGGIMASGEFIDVIRGIDFLVARIKEDIFGLLVNVKKIPLTDAGVALIEDKLCARLQLAIIQGILAADPAPVISAPLVADVPDNDKANRNLPDVTFTATLAGAIHKITIRGTVTV